MVQALSVSEARAQLPAIVERVQAGEEVTLTRHGRPVAVLVRPDTLRVRRADGALQAARKLQDRLVSAGRSRRPTTGLTPTRADALVHDLRTARSTR